MITLTRFAQLVIQKTDTTYLLPGSMLERHCDCGEIDGAEKIRGRWKVPEASVDSYDPFLSSSEVAEILGVTRVTVHRYQNRDENPLPSRQSGSTRITKLSDVLSFVKPPPEGGAPKQTAETNGA